MSYFNDILSSRNLKTCPLPLWRLKITDKEYENLKGLLSQHARMYRSFTTIPREVTLFFAEYWRREYRDGVHSKEMVFSAISTIQDSRLIDNFYDAAKKGARMLGIEICGCKRKEYLDSMLYQGGLPMNLVTTTDINSTWGRFVKGLVFRNISFEELDLGIVATTHKGLRQYCAQLCDAVDSKEHSQMPYWCESEQNPWYQFLLNKFTSIKRSYRLSNPFTLDWEFSFDRVDGKMIIKYDFKGLQRLPKAFCEQNHLQVDKFLSLHINRNGQNVDSFDYLDGFCRYEVRSKHIYNNGDVISAYLKGLEQPLVKELIDCSMPRILSHKENGCYVPSNRIGKTESVLLIPNGWQINSVVEGLQTSQTHWQDEEFTCIWIPDNFDSEIIVVGEGEEMKFSAQSALSWTEVSSSPLYYPSVIEPLYDASNISCQLCSDSGEGQVKKKAPIVEFRSKWSDRWSNIPPYGEIFVRPKTLTDDYISYEKIINVGNSLSIQTIEAERTSCKIKIDWPFGYIQGPEDSSVDDSVWLIKREVETGIDRNHIGFTFTPFHDEKNSFSIHIRAPFRDFAILNADGKPIKNGSMVPYSDVDKFNYYIVGVDVKKLKVGDTTYRLRWYEEQLILMSEDRDSVNIPYEGSLTRIIGDRETLKNMLDKTSCNLMFASIPVTFELSNGESFGFTIKEAPYKVRQSDNLLKIYESNGRQLSYNHAIKLLKIDDPRTDPVTIYPDDEGNFSIPETISQWGYSLVIGRNRGRIFPSLIHTSKMLSSDERRENRNNTIQSIYNELEKANIGSPVWKRIVGWYDRCNSEDIPASSLLDLSCLIEKPEYLIKFALILFASTPQEDRENLDDRLLEIAKDLAFQWFWLLPHISNGIVMTIIQSFIPESSWTSEAVTKLFVEKISKTDSENLMKHLSNMAERNESFESTLINDCLIPLMNEFHSWLVNLCEKSMSRPFYNTNIDINSKSIISDIASNNQLFEIHQLDVNDRLINLNQDLDEEADDFFINYRAAGNHSINDQWFLQRVNCVAAQIKGTVDLFSQSDSIRRSIIYCYRSTTEQFLIELNNELAKNN